MRRRVLVWAPDPGARYPRWLVPGADVKLDTGASPPRGRWSVAYIPPGRPRPRGAAHVIAVVDERPATPVTVDADAVVVPAHALVAAARELGPGLPLRVVDPLPGPAAAVITDDAPDRAARPGERAVDEPPRGARHDAAAPLIVCAGPLAWQAGHEYALLALRAVRDAGIPARMEIAGDGPLRDAVLYTIGDLGLADAVTLGPALDPRALRARLAGASAFVLAAVTDAVWAEPLEAMAAGVPVCATDLPALRELVADGGLFAPARDPGALGEALATVLRDHGLARRLGGAGAAMLDRRGAAA
jgi:glycosyltransferase involved in cell wall biosynthesis